MYLTQDFLNNYPDFPEHMEELGKFTFLRTYSRVVDSPTGKRRETYKEAVARATNYSVGLAEGHLTDQEARSEAEGMFDAVFNLRQFPSGRTMWVGGAESGAAEKHPTSQFNCSFTKVEQWSDLSDLFYMLMVGTGVGFRCSLEMATKLAPLYRNITFTAVGEDSPVPKQDRIESTKTSIHGDNGLTITVGDSKEGWVDALTFYFQFLSQTWLDGTVEIVLDVSNVRPAGEPLETFGGRASGPAPLVEMFDAITSIITGAFYRSDGLAPAALLSNPDYVHLRPIHVLDIGNFIGNNVVVGGVRRTAEIFICDPEDYESIFAKFGINGVWGQEGFDKLERIEKAALAAAVPLPEWWKDIKVRFYQLEDGAILPAEDMEEQPINLVGATLMNPGRPHHHRRMSNNSIGFIKRPTREYLDFVFELMQFEGEPGFINLYEAASRRLDWRATEEEIIELAKNMGLNPCGEILLDTKGVCNLTTVNMMAFVKDGLVDTSGLIAAQRRSARIGLRMTMPTLELPEWDKVQKRDRLLGLSLTGWQDFIAATGIDRNRQNNWLSVLAKVGRDEADRYAAVLGVPQPLLVTTVKPEGTLSLVAGGVSPGVHEAFAEYYIRRIRISAHDPVANAMDEAGYNLLPEVGTPGETMAERLLNARTLVVEFPVHSPGANREGSDVSAQLETYFQFQEWYCEHNASNTISVKADEWGDASEIVFNDWDSFTAVSFLAHDGGHYELAPYEEITEAQYHEMVGRMPSLDIESVNRFERGEGSEIDSMDACATGACPIR